MPTPPPASPGQSALSYQQLDSLHALRGFCALYVVVYHAKYLLWAGGTRYGQAYPRAGWHLGNYLAMAAAQASAASIELVIFFFVLSGFFIRYATRQRPRSATGFYLNRVARLYPPYLASLVLAALVLAALAAWWPALLVVVPGHEQNAALLAAWHTLRHRPLAALGQALLFAKAGPEYFGYNSAYWSLLPEAVFYLLVPLAFGRIRLYYCLSGGLYLLGLATQLAGLNTPLLLDCLLLYNVYFALGSGLYDLLVARPAVVAAVRQLPGWWLASGWLALFGVVVGLASLHWRLAAGPLAAALAVVSMLALLAGRVGPHRWVVRCLHGIGRFSFSLYLYHFPLLLLAGALHYQLTGQYFSYGQWYWLAVPVVVLACYGLYWLTERPAVRYFRQRGV